MSEIKAIIEFVVGTLLIKFILAQWLSDRFGDLLHWIFVRSTNQAIAWTHYKNKAMGRGHQAKTPRECTDNGCKAI
jgi:hypothetical protein